jgi:adenosylmethionine-8-amino-7-oxononanoate aminotransferase
MSATRDAYIESARRHLWLVFGRSAAFYDDPETTLVVDRAEGSWVFDVDGGRYLDATGAQATSSVGYSNKTVTAALVDQLDRLQVNPSTFPPHTKAIELAERISGLAPQGFNRVFFGTNGTDANETAVRIARQYFRIRGEAARENVIVRWRGYHGTSLAMTAASGNTSRRRLMSPLPSGFIHVEPPYCYRCPYGLSPHACGMRCAEEIRNVVVRHDPSNVAAVMAEPTIGGGGVIPAPPGYWRRVREICDEFGLLLIFDEVITAFGRTGVWFESQRLWEDEGALPDLITFGKGVSAGYYPISGVLVSDRVTSEFEKPGAALDHGYTFGGSPVGAAVALSTLDFLETEGLLGQIDEKARRLREGLEAIQRRSAIVGDIRNRGLMFGFELVADPATKELFDDQREVQHFLMAEGLRQGLLMVVGGSTINVMPPLTISFEEIETLVASLGRVVDATQERFLHSGERGPRA